MITALQEVDDIFAQPGDGEAVGPQHLIERLRLLLRSTQGQEASEEEEEEEDDSEEALSLTWGRVVTFKCRRVYSPKAASFLAKHSFCTIPGYQVSAVHCITPCSFAGRRPEVPPCRRSA